MDSTIRFRRFSDNNTLMQMILWNQKRDLLFVFLCYSNNYILMQKCL